jgi:hypothetical protein
VSPALPVTIDVNNTLLSVTDILISATRMEIMINDAQILLKAIGSL